MASIERVAPFVILIALSGCATFRSVPLEPVVGALATPGESVLVRDASAIDRLWLRPIAIDLSHPLDANAVAVLAVLANPELKAQRARAKVATAQVFAAGLLPDPTISLAADFVIGGPATTTGSSIASSLAQDLSGLLSRSAIVKGAKASERQVRLDLAWAEWQTSGLARLQAVRLVALTEQLEWLRQSRGAASSLLERTMRAVGRGDLSPDQLQSARLADSGAQDKFRAGEAAVDSARIELNRLLGLPPDSQLRLANFEAPAHAPPPLMLFETARSKRTDLAALAAGYEAQEAAVRKAILDQFPSFSLTLNGSRNESGNRFIGPAVGFTLPLWNRNRGGIAVQEATRQVLKAEYEARLYQARSDIYALVAALDTARRQRAEAAATLPAVERYAAATARAARRGDLSQATSETAAQTLRDRQIAISQLDQNIAEQSIALEIAGGSPAEGWPQ